MKKTTYKHKLGAVAAHVGNDHIQAAGVKALHVFLCPEDGQWTAQGIEIDYAASGASIEEAQKNFADGLVLTVNEHLVMHGNLDKVLETAPKDVLEQYIKTLPAELKKLDFVTAVQLFKKAKVSKPEQKALEFPFEGIQFAERIVTAA